MPKDIQPELERIDELINHGSLGEAQALLHQLFKAKIERRHLETAANLARIAFIPEKALQILHRHVRPKSSQPAALKATERELAVYAASLNQLGASQEAIRILSRLDPGPQPRVLLFTAFCHIRLWDWEAAIPFLESALVHPRATDESRRGAKLWLGNALSGAGAEQPALLAAAQKLLGELLGETGPARWRGIHKQTVAYYAQNRYYAGDWAGAREALGRLDSLCREDGDGYFGRLAALWSKLVETRTARDPGPALAAIRELRESFFATGHWEEARRCDFFPAYFLENRPRLIHLYFGTPYPAFRRRIRRRLGDAPELGAPFARELAGEAAPAPEKPALRLNVANGRNSRNAAFLKEGQIQQRLLQAIAADFYKRPRLTELHELIYPDTFFNPVSSPDRVHQGLLRLREWLEASRLPLRIAEGLGGYALEAAPGTRVTLEVPPPGAPGGLRAKLEQLLSQAERKLGDAAFSATDLARVLGVSHASAVRHLTAAVRHGRLVKLGQGPATRYRFSPRDG